MQRRRRPIIHELVVAADDADHHDMRLVVQPVEALGAPLGRQPRHDGELPDAAGAAVAGAEAAVLDELLVGLRLVELADDGPDERERRLDGLGDDGAALVAGEAVEEFHGLGIVG